MLLHFGALVVWVVEVEGSSVIDAVDVVVSGVTVDVDDDLGISDDIVEDDAGTVVAVVVVVVVGIVGSDVVIVIGVSGTVAVNVVGTTVVVGGELQSCIFPQIITEPSLPS